MLLLKEKDMTEQQLALDKQKLDMALDGYYAQLERDLLGLLAIPSVRGAAEPGAPFGRPIADALHYALAVAASLGFEVEDVDGYVGIVDWPGAEAEQVGILAHLDVVPAPAEEWQYPPFAPQIVEGRIYGRGTIDDKGPGMAALYAMAALRDQGLQLNKTVRLLLGCDEESGMSCMKHYLTRYPQPSCGFTPDGHFPLIIGEKGLFHADFTASWPDAGERKGLRLLSAEAGAANNIIPSSARAVLEFVGDDGPGSLLIKEQPGISLSQEGSRLIIIAEGEPAHGSRPEQGVNALSRLLAALAPLPFAPAGAKDFLLTLSQLFRDDCHGETLGLAASDSLGRLTCAPTMLRLDGQGGRLSFDLRFLFDHDMQYYIDKLSAIGAAYGWRLENAGGFEPLYMEESQPLPQKLMQVYREYSGDGSPARVMGVGTYAKTMNNFLAFGPELDSEPNLIHQANESIAQWQLLELAKIYARAIYELAK